MLVYQKHRMAVGEGSSERSGARSWRGNNLFRVRDDVFNTVGFADDGEIETPVAVDSGLPEVGSLVVFFRVKRGMQKVALEEADLLVKCALNGRRRLL
jgi:hypothetical protein